ncbi:MAG: hypothetical protein H6740_12435 [Alphaproteobacteria bacterium]|nr:hypothetical protein [Alphaproteobacteria bacterium]
MGIWTGTDEGGDKKAEFRTPGANKFSTCRVTICPPVAGSRWNLPQGLRFFVKGINGDNLTSVNKPGIPTEHIGVLFRCLWWAKWRLRRAGGLAGRQARNEASNSATA